jgi:glycosyltransferase involved in cell wall biosynthesis
MNFPAVAAHDVVPDKCVTEKVKVVHIITGDLYAGAERVQELLAERLPEFGYEVSFICLKEGTFQQRLQTGRRELSTFAMRSRFDLVLTPLRIAQCVHAIGGQLIHTHTVRGALVGSIVAAITSLPMVHHVHSPTARDTTDGWSNRINALVERVSLMRAGVLIPVSDSLAQHLVMQGHAAGRISTVNNGVPVGDLRARTESGRALILGMVALIRPRKGIEVLLYAIGRLIELGQPVQLRVVGTFESPDHEQRVLELSAQLGLSEFVEWRGFRSDVLEELQHMDALVLPSLFGEGLPMVVLEAMAVGLPVVASAVEGIPEAIREGHEGLLVPPGDPVALASALMRLATDPSGARGMGVAGRRRQREMFSDIAMAGQVSRIYDRVLARGAD